MWAHSGLIELYSLIFFPLFLIPFSAGYLGSFLSNSKLNPPLVFSFIKYYKNETFLISLLALKTNQLEVNTDVRTLRPVARLKEPRDLFALPKERDNECSTQLPRWPNECQVSLFLYKWFSGELLKLNKQEWS